MTLNALQKLEWKADDLREADPALTAAQAFVKAMDQHPELCREYAENRESIAAEERRRDAIKATYQRLTERDASTPKPGSELAALHADATERARRSGETFAQAFTEILTEHPERYTVYLAERQADLAASSKRTSAA